ncbi:MAG: response regulator [Halobacteriales archaeon]
MTASAESTVLVVEDERELADTYARWLAEEYEVRTAYTGEAALEVLDPSVDIVLLDRRLPELRGREVLDRIRERDLGCRVAMITAVDPDFDIIDMPFDDYVVKPVLKDDLLEIADRLRRLAAYDERARESFSVASKLRVLDAEKPAADIEDNAEYAELADRFEELQSSLHDLLADFDDDDFARAYRRLSSTDEDTADGG